MASFFEVSINGGTLQWMGYNGKSQSKMDDLGVPSLLGHLHIAIPPKKMGAEGFNLSLAILGC